MRKQKTGFLQRLVFCGWIICFCVADGYAQSYNPKYWVEGVIRHDHRVSPSNIDSITSTIDEVASRGWNGVLFWGASRAHDKMKYYYKSPFLEKQTWATFENDALTPVVDAAHKKGVSVMMNFEGVNPYHWKEHQWTTETIKAAAEDIASTGVDAVFEECFEVKPDVFSSLARTLKNNNVEYISGTDPMLLRESNFASLWPETAVINIYNYYLKRDKIYNIATLAQHGSLGLGWAKYWHKPTSLISPVNRNWGIAGEYSAAVINYLCMIRALQFRMDNFIIFGGFKKFDPYNNKNWINEYVQKQEKDRPLMNIVVLLKKGANTAGNEMGEPAWNRLFNSGDAITSGAFNAGYNIVVSDKVIPADAYWIYADGGVNDSLPADVVKLFSGKKPIFIQAGTALPSGALVHQSWKTALEKCGIDASKNFIYAPGVDAPVDTSTPVNQDYEIPYTGYYNGKYLRFTGSDIQRGRDLRAGTIIPKEAINGKIFCEPNKTYGRGPFITGKNKKYVVTATSLNWEVAYPVSHLLSEWGVSPSSNVWGIAGSNVTAMLAIETTELEIVIPGVKDGTRLKVVVWDNMQAKKFEEVVTYRAPYKHMLKEYDFILINKLN
jgi:hypothetical protein